jgi:hypothetical protein
MPIVKFDLFEGRDERAIKTLLDAAHRAVVKALGVPERDRYQIVYQHPAHENDHSTHGIRISKNRGCRGHKHRQQSTNGKRKRRRSIRLWPMNSQSTVGSIRKTS